MALAGDLSSSLTPRQRDADAKGLSSVPAPELRSRCVHFCTKHRNEAGCSRIVPALDLCRECRGYEEHPRSSSDATEAGQDQFRPGSGGWLHREGRRSQGADRRRKAAQGGRKSAARYHSTAVRPLQLAARALSTCDPGGSRTLVPKSASAKWQAAGRTGFMNHSRASGLSGHASPMVFRGLPHRHRNLLRCLGGF